MPEKLPKENPSEKILYHETSEVLKVDWSLWMKSESVSTLLGEAGSQGLALEGLYRTLDMSWR